MPMFRIFPVRTGALVALAVSVAALLATLPGVAHAQTNTGLIALINDYRAAPASCEGRRLTPAPALRPNAALARVRVGAGTFPESALANVGYYAVHSEVIHVGGPQDAAAAMEVIRQPYCRVLLNPGAVDIGVTRRGDEWTIVLARPMTPLALPAQEAVGRQILDAVNQARARPRNCGTRAFGAAAPVAWNGALAAAAVAHSRDMATNRHFEHKGTDGSEVGARAERAGYRWRLIGENIAAGQTSAQETVAGWIESPGHCANLMNPAFTEMGAGYDIRRAKMPGFAYWTQVFGVPR
ncbi:CAP domain-containing protein [Massilia niabensis]|uniref:CAP domain-containing protein n=1 Tax=Massilia niabensis TaxID=544910 RepID=A0ABW0L4C8_9BURK